MKTIFILVAIIILSGCAHQGEADLMDGELFISRDEIHTIKFDSNEFYSFKLKFGAEKSRVGKRPLTFR